MTENQDTLIDFNSIEKNLEHVHQFNRGVQAIPLDKIVGSLGRYHDFTEGFRLHEERISAKYENIRTLLGAGKILPPIKVYKILDNYFVIDGHHRVTVAKNILHASDIDAEVIEVLFDLELTPDKRYIYDTDRARQFLILLEEEVFQQKAQIRNAILVYPLKVTELTSYGKLLEEIQDFRRNYRGGELAKKAIINASYSWYEQRFQPAARIILQEDLLRHFPSRTYTDLYLWIQLHKYYLSQKAGHDVGFDVTKDDFVKQFRKNKSKFLDILPSRVQEIVKMLRPEPQPEDPPRS